LAALVRRIEPVLVSEHLAWSTWSGQYLPDLLPFPRTHEALTRITDNIARTQDVLQRPIAVENPTHYQHLQGHDWAETDFLAELVQRTGCSLLLDVNNVYVSANNLGFCAQAYLDAFPLHAVAEIHLAGHHPDPVHGNALLIDSHDTAIAPAVWALYRHVIAHTGPVPTLIERDDNLPSFNALLAERNQAHQLLTAKPEEAACS
jgi:uncharacterized protein (UPF0276 family)